MQNKVLEQEHLFELTNTRNCISALEILENSTIYSSFNGTPDEYKSVIITQETYKRKPQNLNIEHEEI